MHRATHHISVRQMSPSTIRAAAVGAVALLTTAGTIAAVAGAQDPATPPVLSYTLAKGKKPAGPATAQPGVVTFSAKAASAKGTRSIQVIRVADGVTDIRALQKKLEKVRSADAFEKITTVSMAGGVDGASKAKPARFTRTLTPGTYLVGDFTGNDFASSVLTVAGDPTTAVAPAPTTTVSMFDYKYELDRKLPLKGAVRFVNKGKRNHFVVAFKAANSRSAAKLDRAFRKNDEKAAEKFIRGTGTGSGVVAAGDSIDIASTYGKGSYVLVCFWGSKQSKGKQHNVLGMSRVVQAG